MASRRYTNSHKSTHSASSTGSCGSSHTASTAPTSYSDHRPVVKHYDTSPPPGAYKYVDESLDYRDASRCSVSTYASTTASVEDVTEELAYPPQLEYASDAIPSTAPEFAELFPSNRRMLISHDTTPDGSMNLRVDTEVSTTSGHTLKMTLFHLRMQDLRERKFSLRRYCRDSGREICSSNKKYRRATTPKEHERPVLKRSFTSALHNIGAKAVPASFRRKDIGYQPDDSEDMECFTSDLKATIPTNIVKLEFANYAHVEVERQKTKVDQRWIFEYWGVPYNWARAKHSAVYQLVNGLTGKVTAQITPQILSKREAQAQTSRGGWCPPCSMTLMDGNVSDQLKTDLADVIVATGLIALTDDSIRRLAQ